MAENVDTVIGVEGINTYVEASSANVIITVITCVDKIFWVEIFERIFVGVFFPRGIFGYDVFGVLVVFF